MTIYLGNQLISGVATLVSDSKNIGQRVTSDIPLVDAALHEPDGSLIQGGGIYNSFVDYMGDLYTTIPKRSNVNIVGNLSDNSGVLSNFSTSNYALLPAPFRPASSTWEMHWKVKTGSDVSTQNYFFGLTPSTDYMKPALGINTQHFSIFISSNGSSWDIASDSKGTYTVLPNTTYYIKFGWSGTAYYVEYSLDGETFTRDITVSSSTAIFDAQTDTCVGITYTYPFFGSIDLNECYININNQRWWTGRMPKCFCTEAEWQQSVASYGICNRYVYDSTNNTIRLPKRITDHGRLIKTYQNGTNWYRIYSDGWCEQGGYYYNSTGLWVTFLVPFSNTDYYANVMSITGGTGTNGGSTTLIGLKETTRIYFDSVSGRGNNWEARGYINLGSLQDEPPYEYIVIATSVKTEVETDIDQVATDLNGKVDKSDLSVIYPVIETYSNGTSWYRVYSDGWCEQGGRCSISQDTQTTVTLLKTYQDTNYNVLITASRTGTQTGGDGNFTVEFVSASQFKWSNGDDFSGTGIWEAKGYINLS